MSEQVTLGINGIINALSDDDSLSSSLQSSVQDLDAVSSEDNIASNLLKVSTKCLWWLGYPSV